MVQTFKPFNFYALQDENGSIGIEASSRYSLVYMRIHNYLDKQLQWDIVNGEEEADFKSISTFKKDSYYGIDQHGRKKVMSGRQERFIYSVLKCFVGLASDLTLGEDIILQRCRALKLPFPTHILETSENHLQCSWDFKDQLFLYKHTMLDYWRLVQISLFEAFKDLGADSRFVTDPTCYLRNPNKKYGFNNKYNDMPRVRLVYEGQSVSLSNIYYSLKRAGLVNQ